MKKTLSKAKSIENLSVEVKIDPEETFKFNFNAEDNQKLHLNNENLESWEKVAQNIKEHVFFR